MPYDLRSTSERVTRETLDQLALEQGRIVALEAMVDERDQELEKVRRRLDSLEGATKGFFGERVRYQKTIKVWKT